MFVKRHPILTTALILILLTVLVARSHTGKSLLFEVFTGLAFKKTIPLVKGEGDSILEGKLILDAREQTEFTISHLPGARWIGHLDFHPERVKAFPKDTSIILYCTVGYRSEMIGREMSKLGFSSVQNLKGGILKWSNAGYPLFSGKTKTERVHVYNEFWSFFFTRGIKVNS